MYGKWSQWKPLPDLPGKMYMENLSGSWDEGLKITLKTSDDSQGIKIILGAGAIISYQCTDEGNRYKTLGFLHKKYGKDFYDYHEFMKDKGIEEINMWEGELFDHPYYEDEKFK